MSEDQPSTFRVGVVGALPAATDASLPTPEETRAAERLAVFLDRVTARAREAHRLTLTTFTHGPGSQWARDRAHCIILVPRLGEVLAAERELVEWSDGLVVVGNPAKWSRLIRLARAAGKPARLYPG